MKLMQTMQELSTASSLGYPNELLPFYTIMKSLRSAHTAFGDISAVMRVAINERLRLRVCLH